ncbi:hypothetical protein EK904_009196, partial [Melospiza melodia maxima]
MRSKLQREREMGMGVSAKKNKHKKRDLVNNGCSELNFDYPSTGPWSFLLESVTISSAPTESAFLLGFFHVQRAMQPKIDRQKKKVHVPAIQGT